MPDDSVDPVHLSAVRARITFRGGGQSALELSARKSKLDKKRMLHGTPGKNTVAPLRAHDFQRLIYFHL